MAQITVAKHAGFCFGVTRACKTAYEELEKARQEGQTLYCLGLLIHNKQVISELKEKGLVFIDSIDQAPEGSRVLIRAHGEPDETYEKAHLRGIEIVDATCPFVEKIHKIARESEETLVIGDETHPEVIGILGSAKKPLGATVDPSQVRAKIGPNTTIVAQTTITLETFNSCTDGLNCKAINTICNATEKRQEAAAQLAKKSDLMVVIGDRESSNSRKLEQICSKYCKKVVFVEKSSDLSLNDIQKYYRIGVAASASAPERNIKEVVASMSDAFKNLNPNSEMAAFMEEIEKSLKLPGRNEIVDGTVVQVTKNHVVVNMGCKKDGILPKEEVALEEGQELTDAFKAGDEVQAKVIKTDDGDGNILLSKKRLQSGENWDEINAAFESKELIDVTIVREVKGGVIANFKEVSGFIPMSQLADRFVETAEEFIGKTLPVRVTRVDQKRGKVVFSHKVFLNEEKNKKIAEIWDTLSVGDIVEGKVMRFTDYGAFVDIGGIDGLLHISEISWGKLKHPQEVLEIGQVLNVKILSMNAEKGKISLGLKQNAPEPWTVIDEQYQVGQTIKGKVVQLKDYGAFIELAPGLDGLVHISEIAYKRVNKVSEELSLGQEVEAKILEIDKEKKRISLSIKATLPEPEKPVEEAKAEEPKAEETPAE